jgi:sugar porter (SP) family MFS transporter
VSPPEARGWLVSLNQLAITGGIVLSYLVDYALAGARGWGWMLGLAALPAAALGIGMAFMPESPRWLMARGRDERARDVLRRCRGGDPVEGELGAIRATLRERRGTWAEVFQPGVRPALVVGIGLALFQQITGINTVIYYAPTIFQMAGFRSEAGAILATVGVGVVNVLLTVVAMGLVDRVGRRPLLLVSLGGMIVSLSLLALAFAVAASSPALGWMAVGSLMLYVAFFAIGLGPVFWLLIAEIYPLAVRGRAMSLASLANWGSNLLVALTFLSLIELVGPPGTFWLFAVLGVVAWLFVFALVPETRGKSLEEIDLQMRGRSRSELP